MILSLDGKKVPRTRSLAALRKAIRQAPAKKDVKVVVHRDGKVITLTIRWER